jgi:hypothetical protein
VSLFAEGHVYRQAAERPRKLIVVLGVWLIFGTLALAGVSLMLMRENIGVFGIFTLVISVVLIYKSTRNYLSRGRAAEKQDG